MMKFNYCIGSMNFFYRVLVASYSMSLFSEWVITPIYAIFVQWIGGSLIDASWAVAIFLITQWVLTMIIHRRKHTYKQEQILLIVWRLLRTAWICTYLIVGWIWTLFLAQFLMGVGNAFGEPLFDKALATHTDRWKEEYERSVFESAKSIVEWISWVIGAAIASWFGFRRVVIIMALSAGVSFSGMLIYMKRSRTVRQW